MGKDKKASGSGSKGGKDAGNKDAGGKDSGKAAKGAQSINVRHILVSTYLDDPVKFMHYHYFLMVNELSANGDDLKLKVRETRQEGRSAGQDP